MGVEGVRLLLTIMNKKCGSLEKVLKHLVCRVCVCVCVCSPFPVPQSPTLTQTAPPLISQDRMTSTMMWHPPRTRWRRETHLVTHNTHSLAPPPCTSHTPR